MGTRSSLPAGIGPWVQEALLPSCIGPWVQEAPSPPVRGYKKRADGSTTSYFDREVDEQTKAMLDRLKAPKRITINGGDGGAEADGGRIAPVGGGGGVASAWNRAGTTWEDKDVTKWATGRLTELLGAARAETDTDDSRGGSASPLPDLPPPPPPDYAPPLLGAPDRPFPLRAAVCSVKSCDGTATITSSRGVLRHALDYCFKLEWEITAQGDEAQSFKGLAHTEKYSGTLAYTDVTSPTQLELQVLFGEAGDSGSARVSAGAISWRCYSWWGPILGGRGLVAWQRWRGSPGP
eukprot:scaffold10705_cov100-Isochrysis_galbana.AAC.1